MSKELKKYELKTSKRPGKAGHYKMLSTTVAIRGIDSLRYYCYIAFSPALVEAVGKKLPMGISEADPAYLHITCRKGHYEARAFYARDGMSALMWSGSLNPAPDWLKFHKATHKERR